MDKRFGPKKRRLRPGEPKKHARKPKPMVIEPIPEIEHLTEPPVSAEAVVVSAPVVTGGPTTGALPRKKKKTPEHIKAAVARAMATSAGKELPPIDETGVDPAIVAEFGSKAKKTAKKAASKSDPEAPSALPPHGEKPDPDSLPSLEGGAMVFPIRRAFEAKYDESFVDVAREATASGATEHDLADIFQVSTRTIYRWRIQHVNFRAAIRLGSMDYAELRDEDVERSFFERARGYSQVTEKIMSFKGQVMRVPVIEHVPGDVSAQKHWLANRKPDKWRVDPDKGGEPGNQAQAVGSMALLELARRMGQVLIEAARTERAIDAEVIDADSAT